MLCALGLALLLTGSSLAQGSIVNYPRYDVDYNIQRDGSILTRETQTVDFQGTSRRRAFTEIPIVNIEDIQDIQVGEPDRPYSRGNAQDANTYLFTRGRADNGDPVMRIEWAFQPTSTQRTFVLQYRLVGALRIADAGDQLYLAAIRSGRAGPIQTSRITVQLPTAVDPAQIRAEGALGGRNAETGRVINGQTIEYTLRTIQPDQQYEVRVQFPHGLVTASPPRWQAAVEARELDAERAKNIAAVVNLASLILAGFVTVGGGLFVLVTFLTRGRDPQTSLAKLPVIVREPPTELPPAVVGTLVDERADTQDVVATLIDLANRGVIDIEEVKNTELLGSSIDFRFKLHQNMEDTVLRPYEQTLLKALFGDEREFKMSDLKGRFYSSMPQFENDLYREVTASRLFADNPDGVRKRYRNIGIGVTILGGLGMAVGLCVAVNFGALAFLPFLSVIGLGVLLIIIASAMPKRTPEGVRQAIQWRAFQKYLAEIQKHEPVNQATQLFNRYLPYAIAFGIDQTWVRKFAAVGTPAPPWFQPAGQWGPMVGPFDRRVGGPVIVMPGGGYYGPDPHHRRRRRDDNQDQNDEPGQSGRSAPEPTPRNLDEVSDSLLDMLNRAGRTIASGSFGGGGGWSSGGGGWGGGGGGGGGSKSGFE